MNKAYYKARRQAEKARQAREAAECDRKDREFQESAWVMRGQDIPAFYRQLDKILGKGG